MSYRNHQGSIPVLKVLFLVIETDKEIETLTDERVHSCENIETEVMA